MGTYYYDDLTKPCLPYIQHQIMEMNFANKDIDGMSWSDGSKVLSVKWGFDLSPTQQAILSGIVHDSDGLVQIVKPRQQIMSEIFWTANKTIPDEHGKVQIIRLMDAVDTLGSFLVCLDNYNYVYALMRMQIPLALGTITQADYDLVASCIPDAEFVPE